MRYGALNTLTPLFRGTLVHTSCLFVFFLFFSRFEQAQISGVQDENPFDPPLLRRALKIFQRWSRQDVIRRRAEVMKYLNSIGVRLEYFNGGGSGRSGHL